MATTIIIPSKGGKTCATQLKLLTELFRDADVHCIFLRIRPLPDNLNDLTTLGRNSFKNKFDRSFVDAVGALKESKHKRLKFQQTTSTVIQRLCFVSMLSIAMLILYYTTNRSGSTRKKLLV